MSLGKAEVWECVANRSVLVQGELCRSNSVILAEQSRLGGGFLVMLETLTHDESYDRPVGVVLWSKEGK